MKSTIDNTPKHRPPTYPCLKRHPMTGLIVLFAAPQAGAVIHPGNSDHVYGGNADDFIEDQFEYFYGTVTLENDNE